MIIIKPSEWNHPQGKSSNQHSHCRKYHLQWVGCNRHKTLQILLSSVSIIIIFFLKDSALVIRWARETDRQINRTTDRQRDRQTDTKKRKREKERDGGLISIQHQNYQCKKIIPHSYVILFSKPPAGRLSFVETFCAHKGKTVLTS